MQLEFVFGIVVVIFSVILHEVAHGYMANWLGDPTARLAGRLTLNPLKHIDPLGTIILPAILVFTGSPILIGYAKPVPYNPYNLRGRWGEGLVAGAGPGVNILLAVIFGLAVRVLASSQGPAALAATPLISALAAISFTNLILALFNLIPIPPLDGSKVLSAILPGSTGRAYDRFRARFERLGVLSGTLVILLLFYFLAPLFFSGIQWLFRALTGL